MLGQHPLDQQQRAIVRHQPPTGGQNRSRLFVVPIVNDLLQQVCIPGGKDRIEEAPTNDLAAIGHVGRCNQRWRARDNMRPIKQDAMQHGGGLQDITQELA